MARFEAAIGAVLAHEGGLVDHPADPGGITHYGISLRFVLDAQVDGDVDRDGDEDADDIRALTVPQATALYRRHFWDALGLDRLVDQAVAGKVLDLAVNVGRGQATRLLQRALRACGLVGVVEDGALGPATVQAANVTEPRLLRFALRLEAVAFYVGLWDRATAKRMPFVRGWLRRALA